MASLYNSFWLLYLKVLLGTFESISHYWLYKILWIWFSVLVDWYLID